MVGPTATRSTPSCSSIDQRLAIEPSTCAGGGVRRGGAVEVEAVEVGGAVVGHRLRLGLRDVPAADLPARAVRRAGQVEVLARHVDRLARRRHRGGVGGRRVVHVEADDRDRAEPGVGGGDRDVVAPDELLACRPVGAVVVTCGSQSSMVLDRTTPWFFSSAVPSRRNKPGCAKSRSGSPAETTSRTTSPCWRAVTSVESYADSRTTVGALGSATSTTSTRVPGATRPGAAPGSRPITTTRSPDEQQLGGEHGVEGQRTELDRLGAGDVVHDQGAVVDDPHQQRPSVLTTSGSSTPASWTLVPVSLDVASAGCAASGESATLPATSCRRAGSPSRTASRARRRGRRTTPAARRTTPPAGGPR